MKTPERPRDCSTKVSCAVSPVATDEAALTCRGIEMRRPKPRSCAGMVPSGIGPAGRTVTPGWLLRPYTLMVGCSAASAGGAGVAVTGGVIT